MSKWKLSALMMLLPLAASAQGGGESVSKHFHAFVTHHTKILIDTAESMPADKYSYKPTAAQWTFGKVNDKMLADSVTYYGERATRESPLIGLVEDWSDHYSQLAGYLRLNNLLPPTAKNGGM